MESVQISFEDSLTDFTLSMYGTFNSNQSICFAPFSLTAGLMLVMLGAAGKTREELSSGLFKDSTLSEIEKLRKYKSLNDDILGGARKDSMIANALGIFVNERFNVRRRFRRKAKRFLRTPVHMRQFSSSKIDVIREGMNNWVSEKTKKKITNILSGRNVNVYTFLVMISAVYFRGIWLTEFDPSNTKQEEFHVGKGLTVPVEMMKMNKVVPYVEMKNYSAIALPFKGNFDMVFILPHAKDGLASLEARLSTRSLEALDSSLKKKRLNIVIPKFIINSGIDMRKSLPELGVEDIFKMKANFSRLYIPKTFARYLYFWGDDVIHQVLMEIDEKGRNGTAAAANVLSSGKTFNATHPFMFFIRDVRTRVIIFIGRYKGT